MSNRRHHVRVAVGVALIVALLVWSVGRMTADPSSLPVRDFVEYYSAGSSFLAGGNPYSGPELLEVQRQILGRPELDEATMMWNPPWVLTLVAPFAALPVGIAHKLWVLSQLLCVFGSVWMLWRVYDGPRRKEWVGFAVAATFPPVLFLVWWGQIGGLVLLGLAGYLYHGSRGRYWLAGLFAALTAIKPHLLFAFGLVLVLDAVVSAWGRKVVLTGAVALGAAALTAWAIHPGVYDHYRSAGWAMSSSVNVAPKDWIQPIASYWLRWWIDGSRFWIQFLPTAVVAAVTAGYWFSRRKTWDWPSEVPRLVFASVIAAAYGAWLFDLVVLLVPITQVVVRLTRSGPKATNWRIGIAFVLVNVGGVLATLLLAQALARYGFGMHSFVWFAPAVLGFYVAALRPTRPYNSPREAPPGATGRASAWRTPQAVPGTGS
jgi:hypothetical protein